MARTATQSPPEAQKIRVGDHVRFRWSLYDVEGTVIEDRGPIGVGGRHLYGVEFQLEYTEPHIIELPASALEVIGSGRSAAPAVGAS